jgi:hypothetical protein
VTASCCRWSVATWYELLCELVCEQYQEEMTPPAHDSVFGTTVTAVTFGAPLMSAGALRCIANQYVSVDTADSCGVYILAANAPPESLAMVIHDGVVHA